jgi:hypothetical protein
MIVAVNEDIVNLCFAASRILIYLTTTSALRKDYAPISEACFGTDVRIACWSPVSADVSIRSSNFFYAKPAYIRPNYFEFL